MSTARITLPEATHTCWLHWLGHCSSNPTPFFTAARTSVSERAGYGNNPAWCNNTQHNMHFICIFCSSARNNSIYTPDVYHTIWQNTHLWWIFPKGLLQMTICDSQRWNMIYKSEICTEIVIQGTYACIWLASQILYIQCKLQYTPLI